MDEGWLKQAFGDADGKPENIFDVVSAALEKHRVATGLEELKLEVRTLRQKNVNMKMQLEEMEKMMDANIEDRERVISQRKEQINVLKREKEDFESLLNNEKEERLEEATMLRATMKGKEEELNSEVADYRNRLEQLEEFKTKRGEIGRQGAKDDWSEATARTCCLFAHLITFHSSQGCGWNRRKIIGRRSGI